MPSLFRFMTIIGVLAGIFYGSMYVLANYFEPKLKEISKSVRNIKIQ